MLERAKTKQIENRYANAAPDNKSLRELRENLLNAPPASLRPYIFAVHKKATLE